MKQPKIWGTTEEIVRNSMTELHRIEVRDGFRCSLHKHEHKWNAFVVEKGELTVIQVRENQPEDRVTLTDGMSLSVAPGVHHYFENRSGGISDTVAYELYWAAPLGEDIVRKNVGGPIE